MENKYKLKKFLGFSKKGEDLHVVTALSTTELLGAFLCALASDIKNYILLKKVQLIVSLFLIISVISLMIICINIEKSYSLDNFEKVEVTISDKTENSTVWEAQKRLAPNKNINRLLWLDKKINGAEKINNIKSGDVVCLLKEK